MGLLGSEAEGFFFFFFLIFIPGMLVWLAGFLGRQPKPSTINGGLPGPRTSDACVRNSYQDPGAVLDAFIISTHSYYKTDHISPYM